MMYKNIELNQELDIRIYSFPMRYQPVQLKDRSHVGKKWTKYWLRSFQTMLQATRGIVSGAPEFFNIAYGTNVEEFFDLLWYPEKFLFNRNYFSEGEGSSEFEEYRTLNLKLTAGEKEELYSVLSDKVRKNLFGISKAVKTKNVPPKGISPL